MIKVWRLLPQVIKEKPFDVYAALAVLASSVIAFFSSEFPEGTYTNIPILLWAIVDIYMISASLVLVVALFINHKDHPQFSYFGQMWGWAFVASASVAVMTFLFYQNFTERGFAFDAPSFSFALLWGCIGWAAFFKSTTMYIDFKEARAAQGE
jgi:hypothetical protein